MMNTKKERARLERLEKLLDMYEQGERRIEINRHYPYFNVEFVYLTDRYRKSIADTKAAMQRIEVAYLSTLNQ